MKLAVISAALLGAVLASKDAYRDIQFASFREQHGKHYSTKAEFELRKDIFHANLAKIERHNALGTWKMGVNEFSDLTQAEFGAQMTGGYKRMPQSGASVPAATTFKAKSRSELPDSVDWRDQGAVSEVKNQGQCGSCWAFCTTEMIESYAAIATGNLPELSPASDSVYPEPSFLWRHRRLLWLHPSAWLYLHSVVRPRNGVRLPLHLRHHH